MISVIIPVYNAEKYLEEAVASVCSQTYKDRELILVDDGSTDRSGEICENIAARVPGIEVIHKKNGGLSSARNAGIDKARGEYIFFLDADDIIPPYALDILFKCINYERYDVACGTTIKFHTTESSYEEMCGRTKISRPGNIPVRSHTPVEALTKILYQKGIDNSACGKLFSASLFSNLRFREGTGYEDLDIITPLLLEASGVAEVRLPLYFYRQHASSYIHTFSMKRCDVLEVTERIVRHVESRCPELLPAARSRQLSANFNIFGLLAANPSMPKGGVSSAESKKTADNCWNKIKELRGESLRNPSVRLKNKIGILASYIGGRRIVEAIAGLIYR